MTVADETSIATSSPSQQRAIDRIKRASKVTELVLVRGAPGTGRSFILHTLQREQGGVILNAANLLELTVHQAARRYEQTLYDLIKTSFDLHRTIYLDDASGYQSADRTPGYNRTGLMSAVMRIARDIAIAHDKRIVAATDLLPPGERADELSSGASWDDKGIVVPIPVLDEADYRHILEHHVGNAAMVQFDTARLYAGSRRLTAKSLTLLSGFLAKREPTQFTADDALAIIDRDILHGSVDLDEVEVVSMDTLIGIDEIAARIDRAILLPLAEPELARELGLVPKHGVLLHGPPGTGKTTIGRALAHHMKGKFFIIDGDFVHDAPNFQAMVDGVFEAAIRSSPSVIFIDDADVILSDPHMQHFGRYLLTKLDGLQSESLANVCVMMTAMNIASMPPALLRSGRLEVWLKMTPPDASTRAAMIRAYTEQLPFKGAAADEALSASMADASAGFTPADIRRMVGDAAGHLAFDRHRRRPERPFADYLEMSLVDLKNQKVVAELAISARGGMRFQ